MKLCRHHNLPVVNGYFCTKCKRDLDRTSEKLKRIFSRVDFNKVFEAKKSGVGVTWNTD